ncbi:hypothetical protein N9B82_06730 [Saprospiraceae bacterium]|nr:hypothetical protein [Saprospiraceae bacterium]
MKQIITLLLFVLAFSTQSYAAKATIVPMVTSTTVNVDYAKKDGIFKKAKSWVANTVAKAMDGKTVALIAHLTWVGLLIAFIVNNDNSSSIGSFYIRQNIGLFLLAVVLGALSVIPILGWIIGAVGGLLLLILWIMSLINALAGKEKPLPVVGNLFQDWFKGIG